MLVCTYMQLGKIANEEFSQGSVRARKSWHLALAALWAAKRLQLNSSHWMGK